MSEKWRVTIAMRGKDILGNVLPADGALEGRTYAALSEDHARRSAAAALLPTEEIVSVEPYGDWAERQSPGWWTGSDG